VHQNCEMLFNEKQVHLQAQDCVVIAPMIPHRLLVMNENVTRNNFLFNISVTPREKQSSASIAVLLSQINEHCVIHDDKSEICALIGCIERELTEKELFHYERIRAYILSVFIILARQLVQKPGFCVPTGTSAGLVQRQDSNEMRNVSVTRDSNSESELQDALELRVAYPTVILTSSPAGFDGNLMLQIEHYVENSIARRVTLDEFAKSLYLSPSKLKRLFIKLYGMPFRDFVYMRRMEWAKYYVEETDIAISEIPFLVGYSSVNALYQAYKKHYGSTPGEMRLTRKAGLDGN